MKILFTTSDAKGFISGVHSWMQKLIVELQKLNHVPSFIVFTIGEGPYPFIEFLRANSVNFNSVKAEDYPYTIGRTEFIIGDVKRLKPDVFLPGFLIAGLYAIPWIKNEKIITVNFIHSDDNVCRAICDRFVTNSDKQWNSNLTFSVSKYIYNYVDRIKVLNHHYSPYGVEPSILHSVYQKPLKIIYFGRIEEEQKRISDTVRGMIKVLRKLPNCEFDIYGSGSSIELVKKLIENEGRGLPIRYKGVVGSGRTNDILSQYQVFLLLSDYEGLPVALLEAMSCGLVPICTNIKSGVGELIMNQVNGFLVENRDSEVFDSLTYLLANKAGWESMSKKNIEFVNSKFAIRKQVHLFIDKIVELTKQEHIPIDGLPLMVRLPPAHKDLHYEIEDIRAPSFLAKSKTKLKGLYKIINDKAFLFKRLLLAKDSMVGNKCTYWNNIKLGVNTIVEAKDLNSFIIEDGVLIEEYVCLKSLGESSLVKVGKLSHFRGFCSVRAFKGGKLIIGESVFFNNYCSINCLGSIEIGANCIFGEGVKMYDHNHLYRYDEQGTLKTERDKFNIGSIKIGENCWVGSNVTILNNVEIGENVIIGANCLIYKSVPSNSTVKHVEGLIIENKKDEQ